MTAIGKLLAILVLTVGITMMTWAVGVYVHKPQWFEPAPEAVDKNSNVATFAQLDAEIKALNRSAGAASATWGENLKTLEDREKFRADRRKAYADRTKWAHTGNPKDLVDPANPKSGKGFYAPVVDDSISLYDLSVDATGKPKGQPILGTDGLPLPGIDGLLNSVAGDIKGIQDLTGQIIEQRKAFNDLSTEVIATEKKLIAMNVIRDSVQSELFFLSTFEVNVYETRETVLRRQKQLRNRLKTLGVSDP